MNNFPLLPAIEGLVAARNKVRQHWHSNYHHLFMGPVCVEAHIPFDFAEKLSIAVIIESQRIAVCPESVN